MRGYLDDVKAFSIRLVKIGGGVASFSKILANTKGNVHGEKRAWKEGFKALLNWCAEEVAQASQAPQKIGEGAEKEDDRKAVKAEKDAWANFCKANKDADQPFQEVFKRMKPCHASTFRFLGTLTGMAVYNRVITKIYARNADPVDKNYD